MEGEERLQIGLAAIEEAGTDAVTWVSVTNVVARGVPFQRRTQLTAKLLPVTAQNGSPYALTDGLAAIQPLWAQQKLAVVANVGMLVQRTSRAQYLNQLELTYGAGATVKNDLDRYVAATPKSLQGTANQVFTIGRVVVEVRPEPKVANAQEAK